MPWPEAGGSRGRRRRSCETRLNDCTDAHQAQREGRSRGDGSTRDARHQLRRPRAEGFGRQRDELVGDGVGGRQTIDMLVGQRQVASTPSLRNHWRRCCGGVFAAEVGDRPFVVGRVAGVRPPGGTTSRGVGGHHQARSMRRPSARSAGRRCRRWRGRRGRRGRPGHVVLALYRLQLLLHQLDSVRPARQARRRPKIDCPPACRGSPYREPAPSGPRRVLPDTVPLRNSTLVGLIA
jgi:hypothetical protein